MSEHSAGLLRPLFWFSLLGFLERAKALLLLPLYLNYLSPEELAVLFLVTLTAQLAGAFANLRLHEAMRTFFFDFVGDEQGLSKYLAQVFSASLLLLASYYALLQVIGQPLFALLFTHDQVAWFPFGAIAVANVCFYLALSPYFIYLKNKLQLREFASYQVALIAGTVVAQIVLVVGYGLGVSGVLLGSLLPLSLALGSLFLHKQEIFTLRLSWAVLRPSLVYSSPLILFGLLYMLEARLDRYLIERFFELSVVAKYGILLAVLGLLVTLQSAVENAIRPMLYKKLGGDAASARAATQYFSQVYVLVCLGGLSIIVLAGSLLSWITSNETYLASRAWLPLGALAMMPTIYTRYCALFYTYEKKSGALTAWMAARVVLIFGLLLYLVPRFGVEGALTAILTSQLLNAAAFRVHLSRLRIPSVPILAPMVHGSFVAASILLSYFLLFEHSPEIFGVLQFALVAIILFVMNRDLLAELVAEKADTRYRRDLI